MKRITTIVWMMIAVLAVSSAGFAQSKKELQERFMQRDAELREQKKDGAVGETIDGYVAIVKENDAPAKVRDLVEAENTDRKKLYQILADEINKESPDAKVKATAETVALRNAKRNIERAGSDEWLRVAKDHWIKIRDFPRYEKLMRYKSQGKVGETSEGMVAIVKPEDENDKAIADVVKEENKARAEEYKKLAKEENVDESEIVKRMVKRNFANARIGDMLKENGNWRKK